MVLWAVTLWLTHRVINRLFGAIRDRKMRLIVGSFFSLGSNLNVLPVEEHFEVRPHRLIGVLRCPLRPRGAYLVVRVFGTAASHR